jgi:2-methylfumaryl-CoA isomerase
MAAPILAGLRIIELSAFVAAPLGGATLAALGADVIRVDPPGGGIDIDRWPLYHGRSLYWAGLNQGKRSVTINTRIEVGQRQVAALITAPGDTFDRLSSTSCPSSGPCMSDRSASRLLTATGH